jgi:hypothetical protein
VVAAQVAELRLGERYCGPPATANGGYACGSIAGLLGGEVEVTLRRPPPLDRPLRLRVDDGGAVVHDGDELVAEARPATVGLAVPGTASPAEARAAAGRYPLFQGHPFPTCFTCGPDRAAGDGLRIFPGPRPGSDLWAAPWAPDPSVAGQDGLVVPAVIWAALDCPGGFAAGVGDTVIVLGRMAARVLARPRAGRAYCLVAWRGGPAAGRKQPAGSAAGRPRRGAGGRAHRLGGPQAGAGAVTARVRILPRTLGETGARATAPQAGRLAAGRGGHRRPPLRIEACETIAAQPGGSSHAVQLHGRFSGAYGRSWRAGVSWVRASSNPGPPPDPAYADRTM